MMAQEQGQDKFNPGSIQGFSGHVVSGIGVVGLELKHKLELRPSVDENGSVRGADNAGKVDGLLWHKDLGSHVYGEFSMAVVQANSLVEDHSQLESGTYGTFVGVYDGHGGAEASQFVADNLFANLKKYAAQHHGISESVIRKAFSTTEDDFLSIVKRKWLSMPQIASAGSCCLAGIMSKGLLYIANAGDSRAVLGRVHKMTREVNAIQLSVEHNANIESARDEIRLYHPNDPNILMLKHKVWRVKGIIQITKSIGDAYLKKSEFNREPLAPKFRLQERFNKPIISAEPSILLHKIQPEDQFIIFASDGLWEHISNQEAVNIVTCNPRNGAARRLVKAALQEAAKKREMRYGDLKKIERGVRRHFHDDITVIVVFLDTHLVNKKSHRGNSFSIRGAGGVPSITHLESTKY